MKERTRALAALAPARCQFRLIVPLALALAAVCWTDARTPTPPDREAKAAAQTETEGKAPVSLGRVAELLPTGEPSAWHTVKAMGDLYTPVRRVHTNRVGLSRAFAKPDGSHAWYTITNAETVPILLWNVRVQVMTNANGGGLEGWETVFSDYPEGVSRLLPGTAGDFRVVPPSRAPWRVALLYTAQSLDGRPIPDFPPHLQGDHELTGRTEESLFRASLRIAGAQIPVTRDIQANTQAILRALEFAIREKADVLLTPEGSLSGYTSRFDPAATDRAMEVVVQRAREAKIGLVLGTCFADTDGRRFDAQRFYGAGGEYLGFHSKILLCRRVADPLHRGEVADFQTTPLRTFNLGGIKVGGLVCNDMWANPEWTPMADRHLARQLAAMGARLIFLSVNSGVEEGENLALHRTFHESNLQLRARNAGTWVAVANAADPSGRLDVTCPSGIVSPEGRWVLRADPKGEQFFVYTVELIQSGD